MRRLRLQVAEAACGKKLDRGDGGEEGAVGGLTCLSAVGLGLLYSSGIRLFGIVNLRWDESLFHSISVESYFGHVVAGKWANAGVCA